MKQSTFFYKSIFSLLLISNVLYISAQITWNGGIGDWHDPGNWDSGQIPTSDDVVTIKDGEVFVLPGNSAFALALFSDADLLTVESNAELLVEKGFKGIGIHNTGIIRVDGIIRVLDILDPHSTGIINDGQLINQNTIDCEGITEGYGLINNNRISNDGTINISQCGTWCFYNKSSLQNEGTINIFDSNDHGILCSGTSNIDNHGEISIDCRSQGIFNYGHFINSSGAIVSIDHAPGQGLASFFVGKAANSSTPGSVDNRGLIYLDGGQTNLTIAAAKFINRGKVFARNSSYTGIKLSLGSTFKNYAQTQIYEGTGNGVICSGLFVNRRRGSTSMWDIDEVHIENTSSGEFRNYGSLTLDDSGQKNIDNAGIFSNNGYGRLGTRNEVLTHAGSSFVNYGHMNNDYNGLNTIATATFTNNAVLGDKTASFTNIINNGIHVLPIGPGVLVGQPAFNALGLGNLSGMTIGNWGTILNWQSMGSYSSSNNSFTPNSSANGVSEFLVEIRINAINRSDYYRVPVIGGVQSSSSSSSAAAAAMTHLQNSKFDPVISKRTSSLDIQIFPNPVQDYLMINIPIDLKSEYWKIEIISSNGQLMKRKEYKNSNSLIVPVSDLSTGVYSFRVTGEQDDVLTRFVKK